MLAKKPTTTTAPASARVCNYFLLYRNTLLSRFLLVLSLLRQRHSFTSKEILAAALGSNVFPIRSRSLTSFPSQKLFDAVTKWSEDFNEGQQNIALHFRSSRIAAFDLCLVQFSSILKGDPFSTLLAIHQNLQSQMTGAEWAVISSNPYTQAVALDPDVALDRILMSPPFASKQELKSNPLVQNYSKELLSRRNLVFTRVLNLISKLLLGRIFNEIVCKNHEYIKQLETEYQIIYLPTHRSHFDFWVLPITLFWKKMRSPLIAAGDHLVGTPFAMTNKVSAYFIKRKKMDETYNEMLFSYLRLQQKFGFAQMVFIEGTRSKSGLTLQPKSGILSQFINAFLSDQHRPLLFIPVNISYDYVVRG